MSPSYFRLFNLNLIKSKPCINCKHYIISETNNYATAKCNRVLYQSSDTGLNKFEYAYIVRSDDKLCGIKGKKFVKKDNE